MMYDGISVGFLSLALISRHYKTLEKQKYPETCRKYFLSSLNDVRFCGSPPAQRFYPTVYILSRIKGGDLTETEALPTEPTLKGRASKMKWISRLRLDSIVLCNDNNR